MNFLGMLLHHIAHSVDINLYNVLKSSALRALVVLAVVSREAAHKACPWFGLIGFRL